MVTFCQKCVDWASTIHGTHLWPTSWLSFGSNLTYIGQPVAHGWPKCGSLPAYYRLAFGAAVAYGLNTGCLHWFFAFYSGDVLSKEWQQQLWLQCKTQGFISFNFTSKELCLDFFPQEWLGMGLSFAKCTDGGKAFLISSVHVFKPLAVQLWKFNRSYPQQQNNILFYWIYKTPGEIDSEFIEETQILAEIWKYKQQWGRQKFLGSIETSNQWTGTSSKKCNEAHCR